MKFHLVAFAVVVVLLVVQAAVFMLYVWPKLRAFRHASGAFAVPAAAGVFAWTRSRVYGLKHALLAFFGALALSLPDLLSQLKVVDWTGTRLAQYSPMIGLGCIIGLMVFHAMGMSEALKLQPPTEATPPASQS